MAATEHTSAVTDLVLHGIKVESVSCTAWGYFLVRSTIVQSAVPLVRDPDRSSARFPECGGYSSCSFRELFLGAAIDLRWLARKLELPLPVHLLCCECLVLDGA